MTTDPDSTPAPDGAAADPILFKDLALPEAVRLALMEDGYETPSPIQAAIIPFLLDGRDVIGQAQTGTGKTAAFALPILTQIDAAAESGEAKTSGGKGPTALVLTPTRELAIQVADAFSKYARKMKKVSVLAVYGGADFRGQEVALRRGVDVVVGTPGRVMDHMRRGTMVVSNIRTLVLDEADEMLRMGFVDDVEWVLSETPPGRQVALFSATMPGAIRKIAERQLENPETVSIQGQSKTADTVRQRYWRVEGVRKVEALCRMLAAEPVDAALVFVRTRAATSELARSLEDAGFPAAALSGDVPQNQRERTIEALRRGKLKLVVATDVAARGIDVQSISHVFNYDVPEDAEAYIHRIGRTGRAGRAGEAVLFVENRQRHILRNIERAAGQSLEKMELPTEADVHALQLDRFGEQLKERLMRKEGDTKPAALRDFIEEICATTGRDALDVAAFLVGPAMGAPGNSGGPADRSSSNTPRAAASSPRVPPRDGDRGQHKPAPRAPMNRRDSEEYRVAVGRADGVRPGHLVGAIANETGLDGQDIGNIQIYDSYSTIELPAGMPAEVFDLLQRTTVLGKPLRIKPAHAKPSSDAHHHHPKKHPRTPIKHTPRPDTHHASPGAPAPPGSPGSPENPPPAPAPSSSSKPKTKPTAKFKPKAPAVSAKPAKPFKKKFKPGGKFTPQGKPNPRNNKASGSGGQASGGGGASGGASGGGGGGKARKNKEGHSLSPAPFAGGKSKPRRTNKPKRPKGG